MVLSRFPLQGYGVSNLDKTLHLRINYGTNPIYTHIVFNGSLDNTRSSLIYKRRESITDYISERVISGAPVVMDFGQVTSLDSSGLALIFDVAMRTRTPKIFIVHPKLGIENQIRIAACSTPEITFRFPVREHLIDFFKDIHKDD